ncbi:MAG: hypothetical protein AB8H47_16745 [Bacteroidia bacterium]
MKKTYTLLLALFIAGSVAFAQSPQKPPTEEDEEVEVWDSIEELDDGDEEEELLNSVREVDQATFRVKQDAFDLYDLLTETDWPENWEGEETFKEYEKQIFVLDFTGGLDKGIALKLLKPYISYLDDPEASINLYFTDEEIGKTRITAIRNNLQNGIPDRPKKIQVWLHQWPDNNLGILVVNPIE